MKILLDENVDNRLKKVLRSQGFEVNTTYEEGLTGKEDVELIAYAMEKDFAILTHDDDFLSLRQEVSMNYTVIYVPQRLDFRELKMRVTELEKESLENSGTVYL